MIYDTLAHIDCYRGMSANMNNAIDYLQRNRLSDMPVGRYPIDGDKVFLMIQQPTLRGAQECRFEAHRRYADIQLALSDGEAIAVAPTEQLQGWTAFDEQKDIAFCAPGDGIISLPLPAGTYMILFPQDAHMPCLKAGSADTSLKAVIKVLLD